MSNSVYKVRKRDASDDSTFPVGTVEIGPRGELKLTSAGEGFEEPLLNILRSVNAMAEIRIKVPSPPGSEPFSLDARTVGRDSDDIHSAICDFLEQRYGLSLSAADREIEDPDLQELSQPAPDPVWVTRPNP